MVQVVIYHRLVCRLWFSKTLKKTLKLQISPKYAFKLPLNIIILYG